ncbi:MAG: TVP38/TMEM64 family protein [Candidatus Levybacteria bacterium]|nr:TVP38/TMEM64 family protein [Candidatus Levybacteria bacterium]
MRRKQIAISFVGILGLLILLIIIILFNPYRLQSTLELASEHLYLGAILLVITRIVGIIVPIIPGGVVSFAVIPIFGWFVVYVVTAIGIFVGASVAFWLARIYREPLVARFVSLKRIHELEKEISGKKEFMAILAFRLFTVPVVDISSYIAGFTKISYKKFALATFLATLPEIATFYFGEAVYKRLFGKSIFLGVIALLIIGSIYFIIRRYRFKLKGKL